MQGYQTVDQREESVAKAQLKLSRTRLICRRVVKREREILGVGIDSLSDC